MKSLTNNEKIDFIIKTMRSCENLRQLESCNLWISRVTFDGALFESWRITEALSNEYADVRLKLIQKTETSDKNC